MSKREWISYWRSARLPVEAMSAHFEDHHYDLHSHESYSFECTDLGAQTFRCRGAQRASATDMVMAFNPEEPGGPARRPFRARGRGHLPDRAHQTGAGPRCALRLGAAPVGAPPFAEPVLYDPFRRCYGITPARFRDSVQVPAS